MHTIMRKEGYGHHYDVWNRRPYVQYACAGYQGRNRPRNTCILLYHQQGTADSRILEVSEHKEMATGIGDHSLCHECVCGYG